MRRRKKGISKICSLLLLCSLLFGSVINASAEDRMVDGSYLTTEEKSSGYTSSGLLRGKHLMDGESAISKAGVGKIYAYGATTANHEVDFIALIVYVERYHEDGNYWGQIDSWVVDDTNTYYISSGKTLKVDKGYYYRVRCEHFAGNEVDYPYDSASSVTDGIWI